MFMKFNGYKGYRITKHIQKYMGYAKKKYDRLSVKQDVNLWDVFAEYEFIMNQPKCVQMFMYDMICEEFVHHGQYSILRNVDGCTYVKKLDKCGDKLENMI